MRYVVEPHADDAFLSLAAHLAAWRRAGEATTIVTVYSGTRSRGEEAAAYAAAVGAEWIGLGFVEAGGGLRDRTRTGASDEAVEDALRWLDEPETDLVAPLGLGHPEHRQVARAAPGAARYVDSPYQIAPTKADEVAEALRGREVLSWRRPRVSDYRHAGIFRDQARFFFYNGPERLVRAAEMIVR